MVPMPTRLQETLAPVTSELLYDDLGRAALLALEQAGYTVSLGLRATDQPEFQAIANQIGVEEYCPEDKERRFGDLPRMQLWQERGRFVFQLRKIGELSLAGYGWTRQEKCPELSECDSTFAVRISQEFTGHGLAALLTTVIISASMAKGMRRIGLETWKSNVAAWKSYKKVGAQLVHEEPGQRITILDNGKRAAPRLIDDVRWFMQFAQTFVD